MDTREFIEIVVQKITGKETPRPIEIEGGETNFADLLPESKLLYLEWLSKNQQTAMVARQQIFEQNHQQGFEMVNRSMGGEGVAAAQVLANETLRNNWASFDKRLAELRAQVDSLLEERDGLEFSRAYDKDMIVSCEGSIARMEQELEDYALERVRLRNREEMTPAKGTQRMEQNRAVRELAKRGEYLLGEKDYRTQISDLRYKMIPEAKVRIEETGPMLFRNKQALDEESKKLNAMFDDCERLAALERQYWDLLMAKTRELTELTSDYLEEVSAYNAAGPAISGLSSVLAITATQPVRDMGAPMIGEGVVAASESIIPGMLQPQDEH